MEENETERQTEKIYKQTKREIQILTEKKTRREIEKKYSKGENKLYFPLSFKP